MGDRLDAYRNPGAPDGPNLLWPLYGPGLANLGRDGLPVAEDLPEIEPDQILVRHDACGLCFSDLKILEQGSSHPRVTQDMRVEPVVMGHEVSMTVVQVGEGLRARYQPGERYVIQSDVRKNGVGFAYGYRLRGGLSRYGLIDQRVLDGDDGSYLVRAPTDSGYAESALLEPWACVLAAYRLKYRTHALENGVCWILGTRRSEPFYDFEGVFHPRGAPRRILVSNVPPATVAALRRLASGFHGDVEEVDEARARDGVGEVDDLILLGANADLMERCAPRVAAHGVLCVMDRRTLDGTVEVDLSRIHYDRLAYIGHAGTTVADAYRRPAIRSHLKPGGSCLLAGAGGPMGRMHVQHAISAPEPPARIICTETAAHRLAALRRTWRAEAEERGIEFECVDPTDREAWESLLRATPRFDDIVVLVARPAVVAELAPHLAEGGVMNVFAGVARGTTVPLRLDPVWLRGMRLIGHSGSSIDDLRHALGRVARGELSPARSVAAICGLGAVKDGLRAVQEGAFTGKIVVFPQVRDFALTSLHQLRERQPAVHALLRDEREWTCAAEAEFLRRALPARP